MIKLIRSGSTVWGTFGTLYVPDCPPLYTVENEWKDNAPFVSCIPSGEYLIERQADNGRWEVMDVPGRTEVDFHAGNTHLDTEGCILPGREFKMVAGLPGVARSKDAMRLLEDYLRNRVYDVGEVRLQISWDLHDFAVFG